MKNMDRKSNIISTILIISVAAFVHSSEAATYQVGDALGWTLPPGGSVVYSVWASNKTFLVGDVLVFNFANGQHDVAEVTKAAYDSCNATNPISLQTNSPANFTLKPGEHYFICTFTGHCSGRQKLFINASRSSSPAPKASVPSPNPTPAPLPSPSVVPGRNGPTRAPVTSPTTAPEPSGTTRAPVPAPSVAPAPGPSNFHSPSFSPAPGPSRRSEFTVGDSTGWLIPPTGAGDYQTWARNKTFIVGDILVFNFVTGEHSVAEVTSPNYASCDTTSTLSLFTNSPVRITLNSSGEHFFICTFPGHCSSGQKLAINVTRSTTANPPSPTASPPSVGATPPASGAANPPGSTGSSSTPPPPNSAVSLGVTGLYATLMFIVASLMYALFVELE